MSVDVEAMERQRTEHSSKLSIRTLEALHHAGRGIVVSQCLWGRSCRRTCRLLEHARAKSYQEALNP
jgi:hypothetical protein